MIDTHRVALLVAVVFAGAAGCTHRVKVDPITVEPIHLTLDVHLKVDRELDRFFDFEDEATPGAEPAPQPGTEESS